MRRAWIQHLEVVSAEPDPFAETDVEDSAVLCSGTDGLRLDAEPACGLLDRDPGMVAELDRVVPGGEERPC